jgi:hypothetical protein
MKNKTLLKIVTLFIPVVIVALISIKNFILSLTTLFPACFFYSIYHRYCPSCGNTRSVTALLHGDLLTSLRFNIVPFITIVLLTAAYIELATYSFGKQVKILPRKLNIYLIGIVLLVLYYILRNFIPFLTP